MSANDNKDAKKQEIETTGHSWDGIEEYNNPLPKWWLYFFYASIAFGIVWTILYPAWPLVHGATQGILGWDSREVVAEDIAMVNAQNEALDNNLVSSSYEEILADENLASYAQHGGAAVFATYCSQCHGAGAAGAKGYPNLVDDDWLWGGTFDDIEYSVIHGIRDEADEETRISEMPSFQGVFTADELDNLVAYTQSISGEEHGEADLSAGATLFEENCVSCHMESGTGDITQGSANLTDAIWLYGGDAATIRETILKGRGNVMPHWGERLSPSQIKQVVSYVHQLGGGE